MPLTAADIRTAFEALGEQFASSGDKAEIIIAGGAALVLLFDARDSTKDVDAYFISPTAAEIRSAALRVAAQLDLPDDWINDAAKGYFEGVSRGATVYDSQFLLVQAITLPQLLAMKLAAWRDAVDRADARLLLQKLSGSKEAIWNDIARYVPQRDQDKAAYAFEDLWDTTHGTP